ncbi:MAG: ATP-binding protein [Ardenticatenales bacterium]
MTDPAAPGAPLDAAPAPALVARAAAIGYVIGEVRTDAFQFVTTTELAPPRLEYLVLRDVPERIDDGVRRVDVLAQVTRIAINNRLLASGMNYNEVEAILRRLGAAPPVVVGDAKVLGYYDGKDVRVPRGAAMPGHVVERAPDALLQRFFTRNVKSGITLGALINRPRVPVLLDPNGLNRHLAVIAQTGAGKSYTVGVVLEQLLELGGTVLVFDPNSDYVLMRRDAQRRPTPFAERVAVYRVPTDNVHRLPDDVIGGARPITLQFSALDPDEVCDIAGIGEGWANLRDAVRTACKHLRGDYTPRQLVAELKRLAAGAADADVDIGALGGADGDLGGWGFIPALDDLDVDVAPDAPGSIAADAFFGTDADRQSSSSADVHGGDDGGGPGGRAGRAGQGGRGRGGKRGRDDGDADDGPASPSLMAGAEKAVKYIKYVESLPIWGFESIPIDDLLAPMQLSTIDLASIDRRVADLLVTKTLSELWRRATRHGLDRPVFVVLEEAHNIVPGGKEGGRASGWVKRIAAEGRKFGVFLVLVTQRPGKVHADTLSQCGSQIIMRLTNPDDQSAIRRASESVSEALLADLPGLNVGEAVVLGPLVRVPVLVKVEGRRSAEGGADIRVAEALEAARAAALTEHVIARRAAERAERPRESWREEI